MRLGGWALYGGLLAVAAALAAAAGHSGRPESPIPSVHNPGPRGAQVAFTYLREAGFDVRAHDAPPAQWPPDMATLVMAAPEGRAVSEEDAQRLRTWLEGGGRLVILLGERTRQPHLQLGFRATKDPKTVAVDSTELTDPLGANARVLAPLGPLAGLTRLRVGASFGLTSEDSQALPVAAVSSGPVALVRSVGRGEVWAFAGADVLENQRLELGDNLAFWHQLALAGPLVFDGWHHRPEEAAATPAALWGLGLQLLAVFALFAVSRGQRLGPPRPEQAQVHRSMTEYLSSFAWLTRRARVEPELAKDLHARFRVLLQDRQGIRVSLSDDEASRELEVRCEVPAARTQEVLARLQALGARARVSPREFARASRELAALERVVTGRG